MKPKVLVTREVFDEVLKRVRTPELRPRLD